MIFVVDSSDINRLDEAKEVLQELLSHEKISKKPVLVLANKQDNENALDEVDLIEKLDLESIVNNNQCPTLVESCSATDYQGSIKLDPNIKKGYEWLINYIIRNYETLNKRVQKDVNEQIAMESRLRLEKIEKLRSLKDAETNKRPDIDAIESYSNYERKLENNLIETKNIESDEEESEKSSGSFPPVYHIKDNASPERPKSAVQIVRQQLELTAPRKSSFVSRTSNKTAPLHLYGVPRSASARRCDFKRERRHLKSAGDAVRKQSDVGDDLPKIMTGGGDFCRDVFTLKAFELKTVKSKRENGMIRLHNGAQNKEISVVDVDL